MAIAYWRDEYCTGHQQVDQEHQTLFTLVNTLHDAMIQQADHATLITLLDTLANHTVQHFQSEEELMVAARYPDYARHKQSHDRLKTKVNNLLSQFNCQEIQISLELTEFLTEWLSHHIKGEDQKMIQFFHTQSPLQSSSMVSV
uniref:Hemerythrin-like metal-binding protein n=1 Tax=Cyanothece sp. (strain PCC 7425 / ATCC 29141) TaxID=395961 RepID=B8HKU6_CYAP4